VCCSKHVEQLRNTEIIILLHGRILLVICIRFILWTFLLPHTCHSPISVLKNYQSANQLFSASLNALPSHSVQLPVSGHDTAQLLQASQSSSGPERAKQMGAFTERPVSHIISQPHREKLVVAPLVLEDGSQEMPYAELRPQDVRKVNAAARCL
jgi:hypothetical protein